jgi:hypothetical protein
MGNNGIEYHKFDKDHKFKHASILEICFDQLIGIASIDAGKSGFFRIYLDDRYLIAAIHASVELVPIIFWRVEMPSSAP